MYSARYFLFSFGLPIASAFAFRGCPLCSQWSVWRGVRFSAERSAVTSTVLFANVYLCVTHWWLAAK